ncbi:MAG: hypothetical protein ABEI99_04490 [Halobaculum sp.]
MQLQLVSAAIGAFFGAATGFLVRLTLSLVRDWIERRRLRRGLYEEIKTMSGDIDTVTRDLKSVRPGSESVRIPPDVFVTTTYESNAGRVGLLTDREIDDIVEFYSMCFRARRLLDSVEDGEAAGAVNELRESMIELHGQMRTAMGTLEGKLSLDRDEQRSREYDPVSLSDEYENLLPSERIDVTTDPDDTASDTDPNDTASDTDPAGNSGG